jgi:hypothetical protein
MAADLKMSENWFYDHNSVNGSKRFFSITKEVVQYFCIRLLRVRPNFLGKYFKRSKRRLKKYFLSPKLASH